MRARVGARRRARDLGVEHLLSTAVNRYQFEPGISFDGGLNRWSCNAAVEPVNRRGLLGNVSSTPPRRRRGPRRRRFRPTPASRLCCPSVLLPSLGCPTTPLVREITSEHYVPDACKSTRQCKWCCTLQTRSSAAGSGHTPTSPSPPRGWLRIRRSEAPPTPGDVDSLASTTKMAELLAGDRVAHNHAAHLRVDPR